MLDSVKSLSVGGIPGRQQAPLLMAIRVAIRERCRALPRSRIGGRIYIHSNQRRPRYAVPASTVGGLRTKIGIQVQGGQIYEGVIATPTPLHPPRPTYVAAERSDPFSPPVETI